ncbi:MAG: hypothetical protein CBCREVIR_2222, partial [Candidatus Burkholderia crenata]
AIVNPLKHRSYVCRNSRLQRNEAKKALSKRGQVSVHSVQFQYSGTPKARYSPEPPMFEPLLLTNPDMNTLRHQCFRASTSCLRTSTALPVSATSLLPESVTAIPSTGKSIEQNRPPGRTKTFYRTPAPINPPATVPSGPPVSTYNPKPRRQPHQYPRAPAYGSSHTPKAKR